MKLRGLKPAVSWSEILKVAHRSIRALKGAVLWPRMYKSKGKIRVGITMGDPSGVGPALIPKAIEHLKGLADFVVIGDAWVLNKTQNAKRKTQNCRLIDLNNVAHKNFRFGQLRPEYGRASVEYLDKALELIKNGEIDCLVTCPVSKEAVNKAGFSFSGHTEYLAQHSGAKDTVMMLLNRGLRISLVTRHIPLKNISACISRRSIEKTVSLTHSHLKQLFAIKNPRIVVCGLNPHASDNGIIGNEENRVICPALEKLRDRWGEGVIEGPFSADVAIYKTRQGEYDCAIAMYHDQALIPLKLSGNYKGVNLTLGLPFIRTSPLHGTAFDIVLRPSAIKADSLIEATRLAARCALNLRKN